MLASAYLATYFDAVIDTGVTLTQEHMRAIVERVKALEAAQRAQRDQPMTAFRPQPATDVQPVSVPLGG